MTIASVVFLSVMILSTLVLREHPLPFDLCRYFILFLSTLGTVSVTTGNKLISVAYNLISNGFLVQIIVSLF